MAYTEKPFVHTLSKMGGGCLHGEDICTYIVKMGGGCLHKDGCLLGRLQYITVHACIACYHSGLTLGHRVCSMGFQRA